MLISKGTYRFKDELDFSYLKGNMFSCKFGFTTQNGEHFYGINYEDAESLGYLIENIYFGSSVLAYEDGYYNDAEGKYIPPYWREGAQFITFDEDTIIHGGNEELFYNWFIANTDKVIATINYNNITSKLFNEQKATLKCVNKKMVSNVVVSFSEDGQIIYNNQKTFVLSGQKATLECLNKKSNTNIEVIECNIPYEYQEVEYLSSNSTSYIDTGIAGGNDNLAFDIKFYVNKWVNFGGIYGNFVDDSHNATRLILGSSTKQFNSNINSGTSPSTVIEVSNIIGETLQIYRDKTSYNVNGISYTNVQNVNSTENNGKIALFNRSLTNPNTQRDIGLKVYWFKIWDKGILVRNFVPCYRKSDNVAGMFDKITKQFFTNVGTGEFNCGESI